MGKVKANTLFGLQCLANIKVLEEWIAVVVILKVGYDPIIKSQYLFFVGFATGTNFVSKFFRFLCLLRGKSWVLYSSSNSFIASGLNFYLSLKYLIFFPLCSSRDVKWNFLNHPKKPYGFSGTPIKKQTALKNQGSLVLFFCKFAYCCDINRNTVDYTL